MTMKATLKKEGDSFAARYPHLDVFDFSSTYGGNNKLPDDLDFLDSLTPANFLNYLMYHRSFKSYLLSDVLWKTKLNEIPDVQVIDEEAHIVYLNSMVKSGRIKKYSLQFKFFDEDLKDFAFENRNLYIDWNGTIGEIINTLHQLFIKIMRKVNNNNQLFFASSMKKFEDGNKKDLYTIIDERHKDIKVYDSLEEKGTGNIYENTDELYILPVSDIEYIENWMSRSLDIDGDADDIYSLDGLLKRISSKN